jgi:hypothetical protein
MDEAMRQLRAEARRLAQGKPPSQVRYPEGFRRAARCVTSALRPSKPLRRSAGAP